MATILGMITGVIIPIIIIRKTYNNSNKKNLVIILGIISFIYMIINTGTILKIYDKFDFNEVPFILEYVEIFLEVFLFIFGLCGVFMAIMKVMKIFLTSMPSKEISHNTKVGLTVVFVILAIICICTVVLSPLAFAFKNAINMLWKDDKS